MGYKLQEQLNPSLVKSILYYKGSMEGLYEAILLLMIKNKLLDSTEALTYIKLLLQSFIPKEIAFALNILNKKKTLNDANLSTKILSLFQETNNPAKMATNLMLLDDAELLTVEMLSLVSHLDKLTIFKLKPLIAAKNLFSTHEKKLFYIPLIMSYPQPMWMVKVLNSFHNKKEIHGFFSSFNNEKIFIEKFNNIALDPNFQRCTDFLSILDRWINALYQQSVGADLNCHSALTF